MTVQSDILTLLRADTTLMALLTGGLYSDTVISRQNTPNAFDANNELLPCGLLRTESETSGTPYQRGARLYLTFYLYQRTGYDVIRAAADRLFALLDNTRPSAGVWAMVYTNGLPNQRDDALQCNLVTVSYQVTRMRA